MCRLRLVAHQGLAKPSISLVFLKGTILCSTKTVYPNNISHRYTEEPPDDIIKGQIDTLTYLFQKAGNDPKKLKEAWDNLMEKDNYSVRQWFLQR